MIRRLSSVFLFLTLAASASAGDWPQFRGPSGSGVSDEKNLPVKWSATENIRWKAEIPGRGVGGPVVANGRVYTTVRQRLRGEAAARPLLRRSPTASNSGIASSPPPATRSAIPRRACPRRRR